MCSFTACQVSWSSYLCQEPKLNFDSVFSTDFSKFVKNGEISDLYSANSLLMQMIHHINECLAIWFDLRLSGPGFDPAALGLLDPMPCSPARLAKIKFWSSWFAWDWHARNLNITIAYASMKRSYHFALKTWSWLSMHELIFSFKASTAMVKSTATSCSLTRIHHIFSNPVQGAMP